MMSMIIIGALIVLGIGLLVKLVLDKKESPYRITLAEYAIAGGVMLAIVIPGTLVSRRFSSSIRSIRASRA